MTEGGVVLWDYHVRRLELGAGGRDELARFARSASPGVWAVWSEPDRLVRVEARAGSRLADGMPSRLAVSPVLGCAGALAKPAPPSAYDAVRAEGKATLLTSADGREIFESCSAAVVSWDGERLICVPGDRPRVASTAEAALREHLPVREAPILASSDALLLVNAVKGTCALEPARSRAFPAEVRRRLDALFAK